MANIESLQLNFEKLLLNSSIEGLHDFIDGANLELEKGPNKFKMIQIIRSYVYTNLNGTEDEQLEYLDNITQALSKLDGIEGVVYKNLPDSDKTPSDKNPWDKNPSDKKNPDLDKNPSAENIIPDYLRHENLFRRQLKISGIIDDKTNKNSLSYINLCSQINDAKMQKYSENEICASVRRSIATTSYLKTYFDSQTNINLDKMLKIIRAFSKEKAAAELFRDLGNLSQSHDENPTDFLLRSLELRQKLIQTAGAEGNMYDPQLIQNTFSRGVTTGLTSDIIRSHVKTFLNPNNPTPDEVLLAEFNAISHEINETQTKKNTIAKKSTTKQVTLNKISTEESKELETIMKPLVESVTELTKQVSELKTANNTRSRQRNQDYRCKQCKEQNLTNCRHCFKCFSDKHSYKDCDTKKKN
jgi:hypothetical protein